MFEPEIIDIIASLTTASLLSEYNGRPAVFSGMAPEEIDFPYVVVNIYQLNPPDSIVSRFIVEVNVFDFSTSEKNVREITFSILNAIDNQTIYLTDRYSWIRLRRGTYFKNEVPDPRGIQYRIEFTARGSRSNWTKSISQEG